MLPNPTQPPPSHPQGYVSREILGDEWPLTVDDGVLGCELVQVSDASYASVTFTSGGITYAVNGVARASGTYAEIDPIWAVSPYSLPDDPLGPLRIDIGPLIDRGIALCR